MKKLFIIVLLVSASYLLRAQSGFTITPYYLTTGYAARLYTGDDIGSMPIGGAVHVNIKRKIMIDAMGFKMAGELFNPGRHPQISPFGNDSTAYTYRHFNHSELVLSYTVKWSNKEDKGPGYKGHTFVGRQRSVRAGVIFSNRMVTVSPHVGNTTWYGGSTPLDTVMPFTQYDITDLRQKMITAGFSWRRYKVRENISFGGGADYYDVYGRYIGSTAPDPAKQLFTLRKRYWEKYIDLMFAVSSRYGDYMNDTLAYSGSSVDNINPVGFRLGIKRVCYNLFSTQFLVETGMYPGQRYNKELDKWMTASWKNWYIMGGFTISFGAWFSPKNTQHTARPGG